MGSIGSLLPQVSFLTENLLDGTCYITIYYCAVICCTYDMKTSLVFPNRDSSWCFGQSTKGGLEAECRPSHHHHLYILLLLQVTHTLT